MEEANCCEFTLPTRMHASLSLEVKCLFLGAPRLLLKNSKLNLSMPRSPSAAHSYQQGCTRMTLENSDLWKSFHGIGTEMIITKHGRRMFPHCSVRVTGLQPFTNYVIMVDMVPGDSFKYKWKKEQWEVTGKAEPQPPCRTYTHPDSPAVGTHWMKQSLSFLKMKLTNNTLDQHGHVTPLSYRKLSLLCQISILFVDARGVKLILVQVPHSAQFDLKWTGPVKLQNNNL
uniref:T-box domain-containing protein n=1 Tax=Acanthochromis polyacanthus TaxID=80966 RepID=A0A3Q1FLX4_9TELE